MQKCLGEKNLKRLPQLLVSLRKLQNVYTLTQKLSQKNLVLEKIRNHIKIFSNLLIVYALRSIGIYLNFYQDPIMAVIQRNCHSCLFVLILLANNFLMVACDGLQRNLKILLEDLVLDLSLWQPIPE